MLARLHLDSLAKKQDKRDVRQALEDLSNELDDTYDEAMHRINNQDKEDARLANRVLSWVSYALRPLTVTELQHALAVVFEESIPDDEALIDEDLLVSLCAGLIVIDVEGKTVRLVQYTA